VVEYKPITRGSFWKRVVWRKAVGVVVVLTAFFSTFAFWRDELLSPVDREKYRLIAYLPTFHWQTWAIIGCGFIVLLVLEGSFEAIKEHERARLEAENLVDDQRPRVTLQVLEHDGSPRFWTEHQNAFVFSLHNYGKSVARSVSIDPIPSPSGKLTLYLSGASSLIPNHTTPARFNFGPHIDGSIGRLIEFFKDGHTERASHKCEVVIRFLDMNNLQVEEKLIMECEMPEMKLRIYPPSIAS
jgi:hypothetical protein